MNRRPLTRLLLAIAAAAAILGGDAALPAAARAATIPAGADLVPDQGVLFGGYVGRNGQDGEAATIARESSLHRKFDLHRVYRGWDDPEPDSVVVGDMARGRIPVLSIRPKRKDGTKVLWSAIARGAEDATIVKQADGLRSLPGTLFLSFHHEPDDVAATGWGTPADYVAAWRHYRQVFANEGVTNVAFVWILVPNSFRTTRIADAFYPGDDVVDWVAEDAYNWNTTSTGWRTPADLVGPLAAWAAPHRKPLMLAEWGSVEDPTQPQRKAQWLRDMLAATHTWPQLKALSYFDTVGNCDWTLDSTPQSLQAFVDIGNDAWAHTRASAYLAPSARLGVAPLTVTLDGSGSTGTGAAGGSGIATWSLDFGDGSAPASGTGQPPATLTHRYAAGTFTARLRVLDSTGASDQDTATITAAGPPVISGMVNDVTTTSASVRVWVSPQGFAATAHAEWGLTTGYGKQSAAVAIPSTTTTAALVFPLAGLQPGSRYYVRVLAGSAAGTAERDWQLSTPGAPVVTAKGATQVTESTALLNGRVNPNLLQATYYYEWGSSTAYGHRTAQGALDAAGWDVSVPAGLSSLSGNRTYHYRLVAANSAGVVRGVDQTLTTD